MSDLKFTLNRRGVRQLLRSQEMMNICTGHAYRTLHSLGEGYSVTYRTGKNRVNAEIAAVTPQTAQDQLDNNTILKALK